MIWSSFLIPALSLNISATVSSGQQSGCWQRGIKGRSKKESSSGCLVENEGRLKKTARESKPLLFWCWCGSCYCKMLQVCSVDYFIMNFVYIKC
uniref:Secreted protein n=1 Tax=Manihot esculenta TaxID=3983 RepID=A0A2C9V0U3_MANES